MGCDRVARNGDAANKIGTDGDGIPIEQRAAEEVTEMWYKERMAPEGVKVFNPAFDVTDHSLITGIITEKGLCRAPYEDAFRSLGIE